MARPRPLAGTLRGLPAIHQETRTCSRFRALQTSFGGVPENRPRPKASRMKSFTQALTFLLVALCPQLCLAVGSAELYSSQAYGYGRFEARARLAAGDGVVSSFFLWKDGSEKAGTFWNELDFEKLGADCHVETNAIYGNPNTNHSKRAT